MGALSTNQHLAVFVSTAAAGVAKTAANLAVGEITFVEPGKSGTAGTVLPPVGKAYRVVYKDGAGVVRLSQTIEPDTIIKTDTALVAAVPAVEKVGKITIGTVVEGKNYIIKLAVPNYGGLIGSQDEVYFYGTFYADTGATATQVAAGLVASLKAATGKAPVPFVDITSTGAVIAVAGLPQPYVKSLWDGKQVNFLVSIADPEEAWAGEDASGGVLAVLGSGTGKQVAVQEEFYAGYNTGWANRGIKSPQYTEPVLLAEPDGKYSSLTTVFETERKGASPAYQRQTVICYFKEVVV